MGSIVNNKLLMDGRGYYFKFVLGVTNQREKEYYRCIVEIFEDEVFVGRLIYLPYYKEV